MPRAMVVFDKLMSRLGFVRLGRYGLMLSPEDRILSLRPAIDDGMGGRIVGWRDADLVSAELQPWQATIPSLVQPPVFRAPAMPPPVPVRAAATISPIAAPAVAEPEEDWEWTLAVARARADAADASPTQPPVGAKTAPMRVPTAARAVGLTVPPPVVAAPALALAEPEIESWDDQSSTSLPPPAQPVRTVIPVPSLTRGAQLQLQPLAYRPEPVVRAPQVRPLTSSAPAARQAPGAKLASVVPLESRRFPRGTRPVDQDVVAANDDRTETQLHAAPEHDTRTQIKAVAASNLRAIPSIKQRMAGH